MSLNWDMTKVKDLKAIQTEKEASISHVIIMATMSVDLGNITEDNIDEWLFRMSAYNIADGTDGFGYEKGKPWNPSREDLVKRIGLRTNVITKTRRQFMKKVVEIMERRITNKIKREKEQEVKIPEGYTVIESANDWEQTKKEGRYDELCYCGNLQSLHEGMNGHGPCPESGCSQFTWKCSLRRN